MNRNSSQSCARRTDAVRGLCVTAIAWLALHAGSASAVPSYARQTQQPCSACHVGGFGPQLTPFGRQFKLSGYTLKVGEDRKVPLSAMLVESYTETAKAQAEAPADHFGRNSNTELQQASVFVAGRLSQHAGVFAQATYEQSSGLVGWDNAELRYARMFSGKKHNGLWGLTVNNNPTLTDVYNTAPAWQYPYMAPDLAPGAPAAPMLLGGLGGQVIGVSAYAQIDGRWYLEGGGYRSLSPAFLRRVNGDYDGRLKSLAPYLRVAYGTNIGKGNVEVGGFLLNAQRGLVGEDAAGHAVPLAGPSDHFRDMGLDASYQRFTDRHTLTINALWVDEQQRLDASFGNGDAEYRHGSLQAFNANGSYWWRDTWGVTIGAFAYDGSRDSLLYGNGRPDTRGGTAEVDWNPLGHGGSWGAPWANIRVGAQYTFYSRFNGSTRDVDADGSGRRASDNNTFFLYLWLAL